MDTVPVTQVIRYRAGKRGMKLSIIPDKLVKAEYDSQAKLDGDSRGPQSNPAAAMAIAYGKAKLAASWYDAAVILGSMIHDLSRGMCPQTFVCGTMQLETPINPERTARPYVHCGQTVHTPLKRIDNSSESVRIAEETWKRTRAPKQGQRPQVLSR